MPTLHTLETTRLLLRQWKDSDYPGFARLNGEAETMPAIAPGHPLQVHVLYRKMAPAPPP